LLNSNKLHAKFCLLNFGWKMEEEMINIKLGIRIIAAFEQAGRA
jgi:hypothetical protein